MYNGDSLLGSCLGNYRLIVEFTSHAMIDVFLGESMTSPTRFVVVKRFCAPFMSSPQAHEQFLREARALQLLHHPCIIPVVDVGIDKDQPYIMTAYAPQGSLRGHLLRQKKRKMPIHQALTIVQQIGQALLYAHQQHVVHGQLKPNNILFSSQGEPLIADFQLRSTLFIDDGVVMCTSDDPDYRAPEATSGVITAASDQYSLACIAYDMLTGQKFAMQRQTGALAIAEIEQSEDILPPILIQILHKALSTDPQQRYPDMQAFLNALSSVQLSPRIVATVDVNIDEEQLTIDEVALEPEHTCDQLPFPQLTPLVANLPGRLYITAAQTIHFPQTPMLMRQKKYRVLVLSVLVACLLLFVSSLTGTLWRRSNTEQQLIASGSIGVAGRTALTGSLATSTPLTSLAPLPMPSSVLPLPHVGMTPTATKNAQMTCKISYSVAADWNTGFEGLFVIQNTGHITITTWVLAWSFSGNQQVTESWGSTYHQSGSSVTLQAESWDATLGPGKSIYVGFLAAYHGSNAAPTRFTLNGTVCA